MKATRCCCPKESFDTEVSRFSAIPSASNNQAISASERRPVRLFFRRTLSTALNSGKDAVPGTSSQANGSAGRSTPRRSTREYPGHRKESFPNNRAGSRTNSHKTTTFPIPKPLRPDIHVPCRTLHPSAKSPTPRADYPQNIRQHLPQSDFIHRPISFFIHPAGQEGEPAHEPGTLRRLRGRRNASRAESNDRSFFSNMGSTKLDRTRRPRRTKYQNIASHSRRYSGKTR